MSWADVAARTPKPERKSHRFGIHRGGGNNLKRIEDFIARHKIAARGPMSYKGGLKWQIDCPFNPEHKSPDALITVSDDGAIGYMCSHDSCADKRGWKHLREKFGETGLEPVTQAMLSSNWIAELPEHRATATPINYLRDGELIEGGITVLAGAAGSGKSTLAHAWARDLIADGRLVLILDRENPQSIAAERSGRIGLEDGALLRYAGVWTCDGNVPGLDNVHLIEWVKAEAVKPFVIIDSMIAFMDAGTSENNSNDVRAWFQRARRLANLGATVCVIHHNGKAEGAKSYRGSSDIPGAADLAFTVTSTKTGCGELDTLTLSLFKQRVLGSVIGYRYDGGRFTRDDHNPVTKAKVQGVTLRGLLADNPGITKSKFEALAFKVGVVREKVRDWIDAGVKEGSVLCQAGGRKAQLLYLSGDFKTCENDLPF